MTLTNTSNRAFLFVFLLSILVLIVFLSSCAGGSVGTGGQRFQGTILTRGAPLQATLSFPNGDEVDSSVDGRFSLTTSPFSGDVPVQLIAAEGQASFVIENVETDDQEITILIEVDFSTVTPSAVATVTEKKKRDDVDEGDDDNQEEGDAEDETEKGVHDSDKQDFPDSVDDKESGEDEVDEGDENDEIDEVDDADEIDEDDEIDEVDEVDDVDEDDEIDEVDEVDEDDDPDPNDLTA